MVGTLKGTTAAFTKVFKAFANPQVYKLSYAIGKAGVGLATLQMFSEAQHAILTGKAMSGEERYRSILQNVITFASLEAAGFVTKPIHWERIGVGVAKALGLDKRFSDILSSLESQQADLKTSFEALKRSSSPDPAEMEKLLKGMQDLWAKELSLLERGLKGHAISKDQYTSALENYDAATLRLELQLANLGIDVPGGASKASFRPRIGEGVVSFAPGSKSVIDQFYADKGGTVRPTEDGGFEGRLPTGEVTFYVPEGEIPQNTASNEAIAKARDAAQRAVDADPLAKQGLDNLNKLMGARKADAVLANTKDVGALLRALADPGFRRKGAPFYIRLAGEPAAIDFARSYGGDLLRNLVEAFGWERLPDVMARASAALENAPSAEARHELTADLIQARTPEDRRMSKSGSSSPRGAVATRSPWASTVPPLPGKSSAKRLGSSPKSTKKTSLKSNWISAPIWSR